MACPHLYILEMLDTDDHSFQTCLFLIYRITKYECDIKRCIVTNSCCSEKMVHFVVFENMGAVKELLVNLHPPQGAPL